jgi:hypothetical protein
MSVSFLSSATARSLGLSPVPEPVEGPRRSGPQPVPRTRPLRSLSLSKGDAPPSPAPPRLDWRLRPPCCRLYFGLPSRSSLLSASNAPVAQRIEHLTTDQKVGGSNPFGRTVRKAVHFGGPLLFCLLAVSGLRSAVATSCAPSCDGILTSAPAHICQIRGLNPACLNEVSIGLSVWQSP